MDARKGDMLKLYIQLQQRDGSLFYAPDTIKLFVEGSIDYDLRIQTLKQVESGYTEDALQHNRTAKYSFIANKAIPACIKIINLIT